MSRNTLDDGIFVEFAHYERPDLIAVETDQRASRWHLYRNFTFTEGVCRAKDPTAGPIAFQAEVRRDSDDTVVAAFNMAATVQLQTVSLNQTVLAGDALYWNITACDPADSANAFAVSLFGMK
jgi:hypothetical protein